MNHYNNKVLIISCIYKFRSFINNTSEACIYIDVDTGTFSDLLDALVGRRTTIFRVAFQLFT